LRISKNIKKEEEIKTLSNDESLKRRDWYNEGKRGQR
jgi:hypothetical protein